MAVSRKIIKRRIGADGLDINCETDDEIYFDLKDDKKTTYEQGRGRHYRKTIYSYREHSPHRRYEEPPLTVEFGTSGEEVEYQRGAIKEYRVQAGRGRYFIKTKIRFDNTEENTSRKVRVQRVEGDDGDDYLDVERVKRFTLSTGRGKVSQKKQVTRKHEEVDIDQMDGPCKAESEQAAE